MRRSATLGALPVSRIRHPIRQLQVAGCPSISTPCTDFWRRTMEHWPRHSPWVLHARPTFPAPWTEILTSRSTNVQLLAPIQ